MANVFEIHAEECWMAAVAQNEAIKTAQKAFVGAIEAIRAAEDIAALAARSDGRGRSKLSTLHNHSTRRRSRVGLRESFGRRSDD